MTATLLAIPYSPWSERARWALDHHAVEYQEETYLPLLGEPALRFRLRRPFGRVSVPIFFDRDLRLTESYDIARHADRVGTKSPLFDERSAEWNARSDAALAAGRVRTARALLEDPEAQSEALRGVFARKNRDRMRFVARGAAKILEGKYESGPARDLESGLVALREALDGKPTIGERFGFADIAMAVVLEFVAPHPRVQRGPATLRIWSDPRLAEQYADLVAWRDALYEAHRP